LTFAEKTLTICLIALYFMECVFWLRPDQHGFVRTSRRTWKRHAVTPTSFTLLNRLPVVVDPFLLRAGFVRTVSAGTLSEERILRRIGYRLDRLWLLLDLCRLQTFTLLVYLPTVMLLHRLELLWRVVLGLIIVTHVAIAVLAICEIHRARKMNVVTTALSLLCNPLGATRAMDVVSQALFEKYSSTRSTKS
jgi:hypothetical protein